MEMKVVHKAFKFRIYPSAGQEKLLSVQFGHARFVYNYFLAARNAYYLEHKADEKKILSYKETSKLLTALKKTDDHVWLKEADSQVLQSALKNLDRAFANFYAGRAKYPRFKKKSKVQSCHFPQRFVVDPAARSIRVPKIGQLKTVLHRDLQGRALGVTVSKTASGKYFAAVTCEVEIMVPAHKHEEIGVDPGLGIFATLSDGRVIENPRHRKKAEVRLGRLQRKMARQLCGSASREKTRLLFARQSERVANQRKDFLHKLSHELAGAYGLIGIAKLSAADLLKNHKRDGGADAGWGEFKRQLEYKAEWNGSQVMQVGMHEALIIECPRCSLVNHGLTLSDRERPCPGCGAIYEWDLHAAKLILEQARAGAAQRNAGGEYVSPVAALQLPANLYETGSRLH